MSEILEIKRGKRGTNMISASIPFNTTRYQREVIRHAAATTAFMYNPGETVTGSKWADDLEKLSSSEKAREVARVIREVAESAA